jgi:branched-chain amino acid transport system ATP-binding protein
LPPTAERASPNGRGTTPIARRDVPLLELRGIHAAYEKLEVLHGIDIVVPGGVVVGILGPNGAGKTTTLRVMSGLLRPRAGSLLIEGHDMTGIPAEQLAAVGICLIPEGRGIFPNLTVRENILMDTYAGRRTVGDLEAIAFDQFPRLADRRQQVAGTLSGGEQQMLALSRALTTDPAVILLDELSMGLAPIVAEELFRSVRELTTTGVTIVVVEQFADVVLGLADHVVVLAQGRVRVSGEPSRVREHLAAAYLGGAEA